MIERLMLAGLNYPDFASLLLRVILGAFFVLARFRWVYDPSRPEQPWFNCQRHQHLRWKLCTCGYSTNIGLACLVASIEILAGCAVVVGLLSTLATAGLFGVLLFATICTASGKIAEQNPVDCVDKVSCYLWRVEGVYITIALVLLLTGPGKFSLDYLLATIGGMQ